MIIHQVAYVRANNALVVADDTDIFVFRGDITRNVMMISPIRGRTVIDINASVDKNPAVMEDILAAHRMMGCDTVATYHGIGKGIALKVIRSGGLAFQGW